jgi:hypothetical protein
LNLLNIQQLESVDTLFTLLSFGLKYLIKPIRADLKNFYFIYYEILVHKNKFIRKFACQSFSYVLRKSDLNVDMIHLLLQPALEGRSGDVEMAESGDSSRVESALESQAPVLDIYGMADMLFEVIYGSSSTLHSKFQEVVGSLLSHFNADSSRLCPVQT